MMTMQSHVFQDTQRYKSKFFFVETECAKLNVFISTDLSIQQFQVRMVHFWDANVIVSLCDRATFSHEVLMIKQCVDFGYHGIALTQVIDYDSNYTDINKQLGDIFDESAQHLKQLNDYFGKNIKLFRRLTFDLKKWTNKNINMHFSPKLLSTYHLTSVNVYNSEQLMNVLNFINNSNMNINTNSNSNNNNSNNTYSSVDIINISKFNQFFAATTAMIIGLRNLKKKGKKTKQICFELCLNDIKPISNNLKYVINVVNIISTHFGNDSWIISSGASVFSINEQNDKNDKYTIARNRNNNKNKARPPQLSIYHFNDLCNVGHLFNINPNQSRRAMTTNVENLLFQLTMNSSNFGAVKDGNKNVRLMNVNNLAMRNDLIPTDLDAINTNAEFFDEEKEEKYDKDAPIKMCKDDMSKKSAVTSCKDIDTNKSENWDEQNNEKTNKQKNKKQQQNVEKNASDNIFSFLDDDDDDDDDEDDDEEEDGDDSDEDQDDDDQQDSDIDMGSNTSMLKANKNEQNKQSAGQSGLKAFSFDLL